MSEAEQRVVVIQDASRDICSEVLRGALQVLQLKPGDELTLLGVLHQVNTPSTFPFKGGKTVLGYKSRVDSSIVGANKKIINDAVVKKIEEYRNSMELLQLRKLYEMHKVKFFVKLVAASSSKIAALEAVEKLEATWIILDRQMKKDKKYFLDKLACGMSRMKRDDSIEQLRGPKNTSTSTIQTVGSRNSVVTYDEMLPGPPDEDDLFSLELSPIKVKSPARNSSVEEPRNDNEKAPPWSVMRTLFSKTMSSEHLQLIVPGPRNAEPSTSSSCNESKHSPLHMEEGEAHKNTKRAVADDELPDAISTCEKLDQVEDKEIFFQDLGKRQSSSDDHEFLTFGVESQPEERFDNFVCKGCSNERPKIGWRRDFTSAELGEATDNFSEKNYLSEGGFGFVYRGQLKNGLMIAVKQHKHASSQGEKEFKAEVNVLSKARHRNVVMLLGSCLGKHNRLLVYEFVCNGSLDKHLSKKCPKTLSWTDRLKIALGAASGLKYLHENNIIHRDMRPNNILVTHDYEPLLGDFGLARTQNEDSDHSQDNRVVGTFGYLAPEYAESGKVSTKTDVYSFGVVLLELITGRRAIDNRLGKKSLVEWARPLLKERKYQDLIDSRILDSHDVLQLFWMVRIAEKCVSKDPDERLSMDKVVWALKCIIDGKTVTGIEDNSPERSVGSMREPIEPQEESEVSPVSRSQMSEEFSTASSSKTFCRRSSISITSISSEDSITGSGKSRKKKISKSGGQTQVLYGEMLC